MFYPRLTTAHRCLSETPQSANPHKSPSSLKWRVSVLFTLNQSLDYGSPWTLSIAGISYSPGGLSTKRRCPGHFYSGYWPLLFGATIRICNSYSKKVSVILTSDEAAVNYLSPGVHEELTLGGASLLVQPCLGTRSRLHKFLLQQTTPRFLKKQGLTWTRQLARTPQGLKVSAWRAGVDQRQSTESDPWVCHSHSGSITSYTVKFLSLKLNVLVCQMDIIMVSTSPVVVRNKLNNVKSV